MERVERINTVMVYPQQQAGFVPRCDIYTIDMD